MNQYFKYLIAIIIIAFTYIGYVYGKMSANSGKEVTEAHLTDSTLYHTIDSLNIIIKSFKDSVVVKKDIKYLNRYITKYDTNGKLVSTIEIHDTIFVSDSTNKSESNSIALTKVNIKDSVRVKDSVSITTKFVDKFNHINAGLKTNVNLAKKVFVNYNRDLPLNLNVGTELNYNVDNNKFDYNAFLQYQIHF